MCGALLLALSACGGGGGGGGAGAGSAGGGTVIPVTPATPTAPPPPGASGGPFAYVANFGDGTISILDLSSNTVVKTIAIGINPESVAANLGTPFVFISDFFTSRVYAYDTRTGAFQAVAGGCGVSDVSLNPAATKAWYTESCSEAFDSIDTSTFAITHFSLIALVSNETIVSPFYVNTFAVSPYVFMMDQINKDLYIFDPVLQRATTVRTNGQGDPQRIAFSSDGRTYYVATGQGPGVEAFSAASNTLVAHTLLARDAGRDYGIAVAPTSPGYVYLTDYDANTLDVLDPTSLAVLARIPVGTYPNSVSINAQGTAAYVTNDTSGTVSVIDLASNTVRATVPVGARPRMIALRDRQPAPTTACAGIPMSVALSPDSANKFSVATAAGYRLVGPVPQKFNASATDCQNQPVPAATFSFVSSPGISASAVGNSVILSAPTALVANTVLTVTAAAAGRSVQEALQIDASPAIYTISYSNVVTVWDYLGNQVAGPGAFAGLNSAQYIAYNPADRDLYVSDASNVIKVYDLLGSPVRTISDPALNSPTGLSFDAAGTRLYVANARYNGTGSPSGILTFTTAGQNLSVSGSFAGLSRPISVAYDAGNNAVYVVDKTLARVIEFDAAGRAQIASAPMPSPLSVGVDSSNGHVYATDMTNVVHVFDSSLNPLATWNSENFAGNPVAVSFEPLRKYLYVENLLSGFAPPANFYTQMTVLDETGNVVNLAPNDSFRNGTLDSVGIAIVP